MFIVNILGGLGNQMFQYALGRALSVKYDTELRLDTSDFKNYSLHNGFELLRVFNCPVTIANKRDIKKLLSWRSTQFFRHLLLHSSMHKLRSKKFVVEPSFEYWTDIRNVTKNCYLYGYWQSEKYFAHVAGQLREDFTFKSPLGPKNAELALQMKNLNSVSLHVRRGDYLNNLATYEICSPDYYKAAIRYISARVRRPFFYIFSDDIAWVKANIKIDFPHSYVDWNNGVESYNDMRLMSLSKHNIIANSSFSWWGAWLNSNPEKIVIAPHRWFSNRFASTDLIPAEWKRI